MDCKTVQNDNFSDVLAKVKDFDIQIYPILIETLRREKITDIFKNINSQMLEQIGIKNIELFINILKIISELDINKKNYSTEDQEQIRKELIKTIGQEKKIIEFLKFLIHLTAFDENFIQCGSNSLKFLVEMKVDLREQSFENIRIRDTSLVGGKFLRCNLNGSQFDNVDISGMNLSQAQLFNCKWKNIKIHELNKLDGHSGSVNWVCFSPDGKLLASCSNDKTIRLWDVKTGKQKSRLRMKEQVKSFCFSPNNTTLALSISVYVYLSNLKKGKQKAKLVGHLSTVTSINFSSDGTKLATGSWDNSIRLWEVKTGQQNAKLNDHSSKISQNPLLKLQGVLIQKREFF